MTIHGWYNNAAIVAKQELLATGKNYTDVKVTEIDGTVLLEGGTAVSGGAGEISCKDFPTGKRPKIGAKYKITGSNGLGGTYTCEASGKESDFKTV
jgi:hypothetical protein